MEGEVTVAASYLQELRDENAKLKKVIETHELCHDSDLKVGEYEFTQSCFNHIRKLFGKCDASDQWEADMAEIAALKRRVSILCELADAAWHWLSTGGPTSNSDRYCVNQTGKRILAEVESAVKAGIYSREC